MNTRRRWLASGLALPAWAWMGVAHAQAKQPLVIGWLAADTRGGPKEFTQALAALGWNAGADYVLEPRFADGRVE